MTEELFHAKEPLSDTTVTGLQRASSRAADLAILQEQIDRLRAAAAARDSEATLVEIAVIVPEFRSQTLKPDTSESRPAAQ